MKKKLWILIITVILFGLSVLNPTEKEHKAAFAEDILREHPNTPLGSAENDMIRRQDYHYFVIFSATTDPLWRPHDLEIGPQAPTTIGFFKKVWVRPTLGTR